MKKAILKRTADIIEKIGVAGVAVGLFQSNTTGTWLGILFLLISYIFTAWEARS